MSPSSVAQRKNSFSSRVDEPNRYANRSSRSSEVLGSISFPQHSAQHTSIRTIRNIFDVFSICVIVFFAVCTFVAFATIFTLKHIDSIIATDEENASSSTKIENAEMEDITPAQFVCTNEISSLSLAEELRILLVATETEVYPSDGDDYSTIVQIELQYASGDLEIALNNLRTFLLTSNNALDQFNINFVLIFTHDGRMIEQVCSFGFDDEYCGTIRLESCEQGQVGENCEMCLNGYFGVSCGACPACSEHGTCDDSVTGSGECICDDGWDGTLCQIQQASSLI